MTDNVQDQSAATRLVTALQQLKDVYGNLIEMELRKKEAILRGGTEEIRTLTEEEERLLDEFDARNRKTREAFADWQQQLGLAPDPHASLAGVLAKLDLGEEAETFRAVSRQLREAADTLRAAAEANRELMQVSLDVVREAIWPAGEPEDDYIYRNPNQEPAATRRPSGYDVRW